MNKQFLWIVKDQSSKQLSNSSRPEEAKIRQHVQCSRTQAQEKRCGKKSIGPSLSLNAVFVRLSSREKQRLDYFICRTAPEWSGWKDDTFWNILVLQTAQRDAAIAHGLIAIAAWHESSSIGLRSDSATELRQMAWSQQSKAMALLGRSQELTHSISLISCVILASLQSYSGEYQEYRLLRSATTIVDEIERSEMVGKRHSLRLSDQTITKEVSTLINRFRERLCMMGDMPAALSSSARHHRAQGYRQRQPPLVPISFSTLRQARDCLESILDWGHDNVLEAQITTAARNQFLEVLAQYVKKWEQSLDATKFAERQVHSLNLLQIAALNGMLLVSTCYSPDESVFDLYLPIFSRIMDLVTGLSTVSVYQGQVSFGIDCGLIDIVAFVGSRCREPKIRQSALHWLQNSTRLEGDRISSETALIVRAWINLEDKAGLDDDDFPKACPESHRRRLLAGERYHERHLIKLSFISYPYDPATGATVDEVWIQNKKGDETAMSMAGQTTTVDQVPDAIFGRGHAAFLHLEQGNYHHLYTKRFNFPIPRV
jgi:hypothetical protein